jgi:hypothetical protein
MSPAPVADLHLHSLHSDGVLAPAALMQLAAARGVQRAALTDHDTLEGCVEAASAALAAGLQFTAGVEVTAGWNGQTVHVIGLQPHLENSALHAHLAAIREQRRQRLRDIGERLEHRTRGARKPVPGRSLASLACAASPVPTRLHLARALVEAGFSADIGAAFDEWLGHGKPGHLTEHWPTLEATLEVLRDAGAEIVLAHPHRYRLSSGALRRLLEEFAAQGGSALEIGVAGISPNDLDRLATLARRYKLAASTGSDFHDPAVPWNPPGRFAKLPADLETVAARLR